MGQSFTSDGGQNKCSRGCANNHGSEKAPGALPPECTSTDILVVAPQPQQVAVVELHELKALEKQIEQLKIKLYKMRGNKGQIKFIKKLIKIDMHPVFKLKIQLLMVYSKAHQQHFFYLILFHFTKFYNSVTLDRRNRT